MSNRYSLYTASATKPDTSAFTLRQLDSWAFSAGNSKGEIIPGGALDRAHVGLGQANPVINVATRDLLTVFTDISPSSVLCFTSGVFRLQERSTCGTAFATSTSHETYSVAKGTFVPIDVSASQNDPDGAVVNLAAMPLYDGTNAIVARTGGVDFSAVTTPAFVSRYYMGPIYINGTIVPSIERWSIQFGVVYDRKGFNGSPYPTVGSIIKRQPIITFTSTAAEIDVAVSLFARTLSGTIACYLQAGVNGSDRVAAATTGHIKISAASGEWCTDNMSVSGNDDGSVSLVVLPTAALSVAVNSAIP